MSVKDRLLEAYAKFTVSDLVGVGDLVEWKPGLQEGTNNGPFVITAEPAELALSYQVEVLTLCPTGAEVKTMVLDSRRLQPCEK